MSDNDDCGVCLSSSDYDAPKMYSEKVVKARKSHRCCECGRLINVGNHYQKACGKWGGDFGEFHTCMDCLNIREAFRCGGGFLFGQLWDSLHEFRNDVTAACVAKIKTVSAKQYYMDWLREQRGIA